MALSVKTFSFNLPSSGGSGTTHAVSGLGFQPQFILLFSVGRTASVTSGGNADIIVSLGMATGTSSRVGLTKRSNNAAGSAVAHANNNNTYVLPFRTSGGVTNDQEWDLQSIDSDGFTLVLDSGTSDGKRVCGFALAGITNVAIGSAAIVNTGTTDFTGLGFNPSSEAVMITMGTRGAAGADTPDSCFSFGFAKAGTTQALGYTGASNNGSNTMQTMSYSRTGQPFVSPGGAANTVDTRAHIDSWITDGFRVSATEASGHTFLYAVLDGGIKAHVDSFLTTTTTGNIVESGFGFTPKFLAVFGKSSSPENADDTVSDHDAFSLGFSDGTGEEVMAYMDRDGVGTSSTGILQRVSEDRVQVSINFTGTVAGAVSFVSFDSDGITLNQDDADTAASFCGYLALGDVPAAPGGQAPRYMHYAKMRAA